VADNRAEADQEAFENYKVNHSTPSFNHEGHTKWQGFDTQELLMEDTEAELHENWAIKSCGAHGQSITSISPF
jgi:hypothetical protein